MKAFYRCSYLESIAIPDSVESIGNYGFSNCIRLKSVNFSNESSLKYIGNYSFNFCAKLELIKIPKLVKSINSQTFY